MTDDTIVFQYTRADALADGVLVDLSTDKYPETRATFGWDNVACTEAVFHALLEPNPRQRCRAMLMTLAFHLLTGRDSRERDASELTFNILRSEQRFALPDDLKLKAVCHPGDHGEACLTIMLPEED